MADLAERSKLKHMVLAEPLLPGGSHIGHGPPDARSLCQFDLVALSVGVSDCLDAIVAFQRPGEADRRILPTREQHQRRAVRHTQRLRPSNGVVFSNAMSTSSRQRTLRATIFLPSGAVPRANGSVPQVWQNWWRTLCVLNKYSFRLPSPESSMKLSSGTNEIKRPCLLQIEQLHWITCPRSVSAV